MMEIGAISGSKCLKYPRQNVCMCIYAREMRSRILIDFFPPIHSSIRLCMCV